MFWRAALRWNEDAVDTSAAAAAYYSMFSVAPMLMLGVAFSNYLEGRRRTAAFVSDLASLTLGDRGVQLVKPMIQAAPQPRAVTLATVVGLAAMIYGASSLFVHLQAALDGIWRGQRPPGKSWLRAYLHRRVVSIAVLFFVLALLLIGPALSLLMARVGGSQWLALPVSLAVETMLFGAVYRLLPSATLAWRELLPGAVLAASLFTAAQSLLGLYLGRIAARTMYGAAGSLVALLVWVYVSAQVLLYGAEFIQVLRERAGGGAGA